MTFQADIVGNSRFTYTRDGKTVNAGTVYISYKDAKTNGLKTGSIFVTDREPDYLLVTDAKSVGKKANIVQTFAGGKTYTNFVSFVE